LRDDDDKELDDLSVEERMAVKYYRGLFKEFGLIDLKHYKSGKVGNAWLYCAVYIDNQSSLPSLPSVGEPKMKWSKDKASSHVATPGVRITKRKSDGNPS
jgi:hypothetical protein